MIYPMGQMQVTFGAVPRRRRVNAMQATGPAVSPNPLTYTGASVVSTGPRRKGHGNRVHVGSLLPSLGPMTDVSQDSARKQHKQARKAKRGGVDSGGGLPLPKAGRHKRIDGQQSGGVTGTMGGPCAVTQTLGSCLQCCSHSLQGSARRACKRECDLRFSGGGGAQGDCYTMACLVPPCNCNPGYSWNAAQNQCCKDAGGGGGQQTIPQQSCGVVCVSGTHGNQQDCHYECVDYGAGGTTEITPTSGGGLQMPSGFGPGGGGATVAGPDPGTDVPVEASFWDTYKLPIIAGGAAVALIAFLHKKKGGR